MGASTNIYANATDKQKEIILKVLSCLANFSELEEEELSFLRSLAKKMKYPYTVSFLGASKAECLTEVQDLNNRRLALELIKNMFILAYTDNSFSDEEGLFICQIGAATDIEQERIKEISAWVTEHILWLEQGRIIFEK